MYTITVQETGAQFPCAEDMFVLHAMIRARTGPIGHGCCGGGCGVCRMRVISGDYAVEKRMSRAHISEEAQREDIVLLCCIRPRSDLVIGRG